jgi:hypothetical protein
MKNSIFYQLFQWSLNSNLMFAVRIKNRFLFYLKIWCKSVQSFCILSLSYPFFFFYIILIFVYQLTNRRITFYFTILYKLVCVWLNGSNNIYNVIVSYLNISDAWKRTVQFQDDKLPCLHIIDIRWSKLLMNLLLKTCINTVWTYFMQVTEEVSDDSELENRFRTECAIDTTVMDPNLRWRLDYLTARRHDDIPCNDSGYSTKMFSNSQGPSPSLSSKCDFCKITVIKITLFITKMNSYLSGV